MLGGFFLDFPTFSCIISVEVACEAWDLCDLGIPKYSKKVSASQIQGGVFHSETKLLNKVHLVGG